MKNKFLAIAIVVTVLFSTTTFSQSKSEPVSLGLPGDNLDLYVVMEMFQNSKTIEDFEKVLNAEKDGINNLDLNDDKKVDFIKVVTNKDGDSYSFILQVAVSKTENQDVAAIFVSKDNPIQIVGDEDLYGKNYVIEPKGSGSSNTINPGYSNGETISSSGISSTTTVVVQSPPIVQYVYSPAFVPYFSPFYFGFYPPYFSPWTPILHGLYWSNHFHYHGGYYGGYRGNVNININNSRHFNNYTNNSRHRSNTVNNFNREGRYKNNGNRTTGNLNNNRANNVLSNRAANSKVSTRQSNGGFTRSSAPARRQTNGGLSSSMESKRQSSGSSFPNRKVNLPSNRQSPVRNVSRPSFNGGGRASNGGIGNGGGMRGGAR